MLDLVQLHRLQQGRDILAERYRKLLSEVDQGAAYGSPAAEAKAEFERDYVTDATALQQKLLSEAAEAAARAAENSGG
jgi:hypothetical protein